MGCHAWFHGNPKPFDKDACIEWSTKKLAYEEQMLTECYEFIKNNGIQHPIFTELQHLLDTKQYKKIETEYPIFVEFISLAYNYNNSKIDQSALNIFKKYYEANINDEDLIYTYYDNYILETYNVDNSYLDIENGLFYTEIEDCCPFRVYVYPDVVLKNREECELFMSNLEDGYHKVLYTKINDEYVNIESTNKELYLEHLPKVLDKLYTEHPDVVIDFG